MAYQVSWYVFGPDERTLDRDAFPDCFESHEEAIAFVFDKLSVFPNLGFDRNRGFWARGSTDVGARCETRFVIVESVPAPGASVKR